MSCHLLQCRFGNHILYQKYIVSTMCCLAFLILHGSRYALTSTIAAKTFYDKDSGDENPCGRAMQTRDEEVTYLDWAAEKQSYVFSAFYVGYIFQIPFGMLPDLYGAKHIMSLGVIGSMVITLSVPFILTKVPWYAVAAMQIVLGLIQSLCQPAVISLMSHYTPHRQVTLLLAYVFVGPNLGSMLANYFIKIHGNWTMPFYILTILSVLWLVWFLLLVYSTPSNHPFICESEKASLEADLGVHLPSTIPIRQILNDPAIWALVAVQFANNTLIFLMGTFLPKMVKRAMRIDIHIKVYTIAIPVAFEFAAAIASGYLSDYLIVNHYLPVSYCRTLYVTCGILAQNIFLMFATYANCSPAVFLVCLTMTMMARGVAFPGIKSNIFDLTRHYAGTVQGFENGLASSVGLVIPHLVEYMCQHDTISEWRKTFWLTMVISLFASTLYFVWAESERAKWDKVKPREKRIVLG